MELLYKLLDIVLGRLLSKWRARKDLSSQFEELKRGILHMRLVNNLPVELSKLRAFFIQSGLVEKAGFKEFFERWLAHPRVEEGGPVLAPGLFSDEHIAELRHELSALQL
jgi:hypothetical protein